MRAFFSNLSIFILAIGALSAQAPCIYTLDLFDSEGDGWNGASLEVTINDSFEVYTLPDGSFERIFLNMNEGDSLRFFFNPGDFDEEITYTLESEEGSIVFESGDPFPNIGLVLATEIECPSCPTPPATTVLATDVRAFNALLSWRDPYPGGGRYLIEYDTLGFIQGEGQQLEVNGGNVLLEGLAENADYAFFLTPLCEQADTGSVLGPVTFKTLWANDVGISAIVSPSSGCALGVAEEVQVEIENYGGQPQSLIPFTFSINGVEQGVNMPNDGVYTGVLGKDETDIATFDLPVDFSEPGSYLIEAWTVLESDSFLFNDTVSVLIESIPLIDTFSYFTDLEDFDGGWTVEEEEGIASWAYGIPGGQLLDGAFSGAFAWATQLNGNYNESERSTLVSPCLDLSGAIGVPIFSFAMQLDLENNVDELRLEGSTDGGATWSTVNNGLYNWYNSQNGAAWTGNGGENGWFRAAVRLPEFENLADCRLRFVLDTDFSNQLEGVILDDFSIDLDTERDLIALSLDLSPGEQCGQENEQLVFAIGNQGRTTLSNFGLAYQINGGEVVTENVGAFSVAPGETIRYTFQQGFNSADLAKYNIKAWIVDPEQGVFTNDTTITTFQPILGLPYAEDFERGELPDNWVVDTDATVGMEHGAPSSVLFDNLFNGDQSFEANTPVIGPVSEGDSLIFFYRYVDFTTQAGFDLAPGDELEVAIAADCSSAFQTVLTIDETNHVASSDLQRVAIPLAAFSGQAIQLRFVAQWGAGDYYIDLDDIQIISCPASLDLDLVVDNESIEGAADGRLAVTVGSNSGPFDYLWNTGDTTSFIEQLTPGDYSVTVTDAFGCTDAVSQVITDLESVSLLTSLRVIPNPTTGDAQLFIELEEATDLDVSLINPAGQLMANYQLDRVQQTSVELPVHNLPAGFYFVRIRLGKEVFTRRLVKIQP